MRYCPICNKEAVSQHHIVPRAAGGRDEERNLVWLCVACHNDLEGLSFTPELIRTKRREKLGKEANQEEYHYLVHEDGEHLIGIWHEDENVWTGNILLNPKQPILSPEFHNLVTIPKYENIKRKRGRPIKLTTSLVNKNTENKTLRGRPRIHKTNNDIPLSVIEKLIAKQKENRKPRGRPRKIRNKGGRPRKPRNPVGRPRLCETKANYKIKKKQG